ncbi:TPA: tetrahydromethanopterin S-methyltransferase subunit D [Methanosarcina acetivorans]|jgi:tetrahydromethanopterin S-methyltransferase subunit D|uniref:Tetrahydromethanopterin S-methyltransferase subunit D n=2 Tax=Methanosarcina acetivorans TaxID=2214 RepID=MTRD_METAC|nr:tetrahydromethanopterin S-methyltransferase subunit D [Methanosarcina acetivorans]Q8TU00.1 RecName: Full=Tetrahydromethanopterin S-methyltransferase subunit D; AltName: Full=N5-methyltetrahydromethanopterin--coenzyme M methyltransferase subunit D [Methanosarcina acetivorans C2A]AAM03728.1 tetrahydromethanopterin S-methyltransferase, subunit D [Methanosarcina acetivorans C2A]HIH95806.1 tetrahydromethanopterin S-methyltransferase subunit D [Methanosarcina acetivorans]
MIDALMANILWLVFIIIGGVLISWSVHFVPVGGAPAAMAQATGIGTGTVQLAAGAGLTGLVSAGFMMNVTDNLPLILASGAVGAMIMISVTMIVGTWVYVYGVGCVPSSAKVKYDPITKYRQDLYVSQGTEGHGLPTVSFVSGVIGGLLGGIGGALVYYSLIEVGLTAGLSTGTSSGVTGHELVGIAAMFAIGIFFVNAVIPSYNIGGTIEGFHDPKWKKWPKAVISSFVATILCAIVAVIAISQLGGI